MFKAIEEELDGYTFDFEITEFASLFAGVDSGKFELVFNNLGESGERLRSFSLSLGNYA